MQNHFLNQIPLPEGSNMRGRPMMANEQMNGYHQQKPDERDEIPEEQYRPWKYRDARKLTPEEIYDIERELFVGDLSFFCKEQHLFQLFGQLGPVHKIRIRRNESRDQSLLYGFVKMQKPEHAKNAVTALHGYLFMGRNLRVQQCNAYGVPFEFTPKFGYQIHVSFISHVQTRILVSEEQLRALFSPYGEIVDVVISRHKLVQHPPKQAGYGFVYMANEASTRAAIAALGRVDIDEIRYDSMISHRSIANQSQPNNLRIVEISGPYSQQNNNSNQNFSNESSSLTPAPAMPNRNRNANSYTPPSSIGMSSHQFGRMDYGNHPLDQRSHKSHDQMPPSYGNNSFGSSNQPSYHSSNSSNAYYDGNTNNSRFYQYPPMYSIPPPPPTMNHLPPSMPSERNYSSVYVQPYASFHGLSSSSGEIQRPSMDSTDSMIFNHSSIESNRTSNSMYPPSDHNFQQTPMDYLSNRGNHQSLANSRRPPYPKNDSQQRSYMDDFA